MFAEPTLAKLGFKLIDAPLVALGAALSVDDMTGVDETIESLPLAVAAPVALDVAAESVGAAPPAPPAAEAVEVALSVGAAADEDEDEEDEAVAVASGASGRGMLT